MAKLKVINLQPTKDYNTGNLLITFTIDKESEHKAREAIDKHLASSKPLSLEVKTWRNPRSVDANAYCWKLCSEIAKVVGNTKEDVYRRNILEVGVYEPLPIKQEALESFVERWGYKGTGWLVEVVDDSKLKGYKLVHAYYGSSTYNTGEMYRLLQQIKQDATAVGVSILSEQEESLMMVEWEKKLA